MKKIALLIGALLSDYSSEMAGAVSEASRGKFSLDIISNISGFSDNYLYRDGEMVVFDVPDWSQYDGIIVALDTMDVVRQSIKLADMLYETVRGPVISLRYRDERFYNILIDNAVAMREMVRHFIDVHHFRDISFMTGRLDLEDGRARYQSYLDVMAEAGIPVTDHMVFEGDYWRNKGEQAVDWFLGGEKQPQAIVCANDYMAISVVEALKGRGYRVPEDIAVSGFDNLDEGKFFMPRIATMDVPVKAMGEAAVEALEKIFNGGQVDKNIYVPFTAYYEGSCGCPAHAAEFYYYDLILKNHSLVRTIDQTAYMSADYESCITMEEVMSVAFRYSGQVSYNRLFLCRCNHEEPSDDDRSVEDSSKGEFTDTMTLVCIMDNIKHSYTLLDKRFKRIDILPEGYLDGEGQCIVIPIHYKTNCIGYIVLETESPALLERFFGVWVQALANGIDKVDTLSKSKEYFKFRKESRTDHLTGLNNRREMEQIIRRRRTANNGRAGFMLVSIDMDGLKYINDHFGHATGDEALCAVADILKKVQNDKVKASRNGGDEFSLCIMSDDDADYEAVRAKILAAVDNYNKSQTRDYILSVSMGHSHYRRSHGLKACIDEADRHMYEDKIARKQARLV